MEVAQYLPELLTSKWSITYMNVLTWLQLCDQFTGQGCNISLFVLLQLIYPASELSFLIRLGIIKTWLFLTLNSCYRMKGNSEALRPLCTVWKSFRKGSRYTGSHASRSGKGAVPLGGPVWRKGIRWDTQASGCLVIITNSFTGPAVQNIFLKTPSLLC